MKPDSICFPSRSPEVSRSSGSRRSHKGPDDRATLRISEMVLSSWKRIVAVLTVRVFTAVVAAGKVVGRRI